MLPPAGSDARKAIRGSYADAYAPGGKKPKKERFGNEILYRPPQTGAFWGRLYGMTVFSYSRYLTILWSEHKSLARVNFWPSRERSERLDIPFLD